MGNYVVLVSLIRPAGIGGNYVVLERDLRRHLTRSFVIKAIVSGFFTSGFHFGLSLQDFSVFDVQGLGQVDFFFRWMDMTLSLRGSSFSGLRRAA